MSELKNKNLKIVQIVVLENSDGDIWHQALTDDGRVWLQKMGGIWKLDPDFEKFYQQLKDHSDYPFCQSE